MVINWNGRDCDLQVQGHLSGGSGARAQDAPAGSRYALRRAGRGSCASTAGAAAEALARLTGPHGRNPRRHRFAGKRRGRLERIAVVRYLLDTHIWLWSLLTPDRLVSHVRRALEQATNDVWLSPLSVWEALVLAEKGRIRLRVPAADWVPEALETAPMKEAPLTHEVVLESSRVELPHRDPVDRFLAASARFFDLTLVTADENLLRGKGFRTLANR
jgi:PIN domain nuclease of toxin-antitoxin system